MSQTAFGPGSGQEDEPASDPTRVFLLTDNDVLVQDEESNLWRSVAPDAAPASGAPSAPTPAQLRALKRMHPAYQARYRRHVGDPPGAAGAGRIEIYDPLTASWSPVPGGASHAQVGQAVCCVLPDGKFLIGGTASVTCATYDPDTDRWSTSPLRPPREGEARRTGGAGSVIAVRMINRG